MDTMALAHSLGAVGELFNFTGAFICALDLLRRRREQKALINAQAVAEFVQKYQLKHVQFQGLDANDPNLPAWLAARSATRLGIVGVGFLIVGFGLLFTYHVIGITQIH